MKILIIAPYFLERHRWMISAYKTALYLSKKTKVVVLTTGKPRKEKINQNLIVYRMPDIFIPDPINYSIVPGLFFHLLWIIRKEKPNIFLVNKHMFYTSFAIFWLKLFGKKVFIQTDTFPGICWFPRNWLVKIVMIIYAWTIGLFLLKLADKIILLHEGLISTAKRLKLNYAIVHNGVDFAQIEKAKPAKEFLSDKDEIKIIYVGRLESIKGYDDYLKVAEKISKKEKKVKFYLAGDFKNKEEIVRKYQSKRIIFLGHRNDIFSILKTMDIFILPSYSEGLPNALMEAMAVGLTCLASDVGGVKILIKEGETGFLFQPGNIIQLESKILKLIRNSRTRELIKKNAQNLIKEKFNWIIIIDNLLNLLQSND